MRSSLGNRTDVPCRVLVGVLQIIQYGSRVLMWYYMQYDKDSAVAAR